jgi:hypothetical protein
MKILFLGDYSNLHAALAAELKEMGHQTYLISDRGGYLNLDADYLLSRGNGLIGGIKYLYDIASLLPRLHGFDVVELINPHFMSLKPEKLKWILRKLKKNNGSLFLTLAGNDHHFVKGCLDGKMFRYSEFRIGDERTPFSIETENREIGWISPVVADYAKFVHETIDGAVSALYEYHVASSDSLGDKLAYGGLPIRLKDHLFTEMDLLGKIRILVGMRGGMEVQKGTNELLKIAKIVESKIPDKCSVVNVRNMPFKDYLATIRSCHIVLDQLYSYSPGMNSLNTMAQGRISGSGAQSEFYDFIGEHEMHPIIDLNPIRTVESYVDELTNLICNREKLVELGRMGRRFVEKHNDSRIVACRYLKHWENVLNSK